MFAKIFRFLFCVFGISSFTTRLANLCHPCCALLTRGVGPFARDRLLAELCQQITYVKLGVTASPTGLQPKANIGLLH